METIERPKAMTLSDAAANRVKALMAKADSNMEGLRVGVKAGGCSGMTYFIEYAEGQNDFEEVVEDKGVKIFIDPKAMIYLLGTEMDFEGDKLQSGFVFKNPNEKDRCGCGESFRV
ncbi:MAG: iron-sulfur cluster assembly accessory protein [Minwuiales bacterium]|nr:iron-sulfur cluster assembly accessory protein [Minwuiales bacterium]